MRPAQTASGFHNDLIAGGKRYHVLTEDLGPHHKTIVTQAFHAGAVIATHKVSYPEVHEDLRGAVVQLMREQHRAMLHALARSSGRAETPLPAPIVSVFRADALAEIFSLEEAAHLEVLEGPCTGRRFSLHSTSVALGAEGL